MTLDDLPIEHSSAPPPEPLVPARSSSPVRWIVLGAAALIVGAVLTLWWLSRAQPGTANPAATAPTEVAVVGNRPKSQNLDLPSLDDSDGFLRALVRTLSQHPMLAKALATPGLIRGATLATVQIGDGKTPAAPFAVLRPTTHVAIIGNGPSGKLDASTYARWNSVTDALISIRPKELAQLYVNVKPLFDQAYRDLGHPNPDFDEAIIKAIDTLDETPQVDQEPVLIRKQPAAFYEHEDQSLKALLPVQKQFLLMGPENRRRIRDWLKDLAKNLDLKTG
jgi:DUF3014 family protein